LSPDLRLRIVYACQDGEFSQSEIAVLFHVHLKTVEKYWRLWRTTGSVAPKPHAGGPTSRLAPLEAQLRAWTAETNDHTLAEWVSVVRERTGIQTSVQTLSRTFRQLGLPLKKRH
jgi:transposase